MKLSAFQVLVSFLSAVGAAQVVSSRAHIPRKAVVYVSGNSTVKGTVAFEQSSPDEPICIKANLTGLDPKALRGWHVHEFGNLTGGCDSAGAHFNPYNETHGAPCDVVRHVGDLGNLKSDASGHAIYELQDDEMSLWGDANILGRALVIHAGQDDLGQGGNPGSLANGNSGARAACGVIGRA